MLSIPVNIVKQATISASFEIPIITATQLIREAYRKEKDKEFGMETVSESIQVGSGHTVVRTIWKSEGTCEWEVQ
jgi:hypothetical protein